MTRLVVDASAAISWFVASQSGPRSAGFEPRLVAYELIAPDVFAWEMANLFRRFAQAGVLEFDSAMGHFDELGIAFSRSRSASEIFSLAPLALDLGLSLFDAAYLALAVESEAELVSRDRALLTAARAHAIPCHDLSD